MDSAGTGKSMLGVTSRYYGCMRLLAETPSMNCRPLRVIGMSVVLKLALMALAAMASFVVVNLWAKFGSFVASIDASFTAMAGVRAQTVSADAAGSCNAEPLAWQLDHVAAFWKSATTCTVPEGPWRWSPLSEVLLHSLPGSHGQRFHLPCVLAWDNS